MMRDTRRTRRFRANPWGVILGLLVGAMMAAACGDVPSAPQPPDRPDPMELQRVYAAPLQTYEVGPGVRMVKPDGGQRPLKIASNVFRLPDAAARDARVEADKLIIPRHERRFLENRRVGDIIISSESGVYWRRITAIETTPDAVVWHTQMASMSEVFEDAHFFLQVDLSKVSESQLPTLDLAMPFLDPENPPQLQHTRRAALEDDGGFKEKQCPQPPVCRSTASASNGELCVLKGNPEILCPFESSECARSEDEDDKACTYIRSQCYKTGTDQQCPQADRDSCDSPGGACETRESYAGDLWQGKRAFDLGKSHWNDRTLKRRRDLIAMETEGAGFNGASAFSCEEVAGQQRLIVRGCDDGDAPDYCAGAMPNKVRGANYICEKVGAAYPGAPACSPVAEACAHNADCCSNHCAGGVCEPSTDGYCIASCAGGGFADNDLASDATSSVGASLGGLFGADASKEFGLLGASVSADFKPSLTFEIDVGFMGVNEIKFTIGADYYFELGLKFQFQRNFSNQVGADKSITLFGFAILGYPFSVDLDLRAMASMAAAIEGSFEPKFGYYTYHSEADWTEALGPDGDQGPYPGSKIPYKWDPEAANAAPGMQVGLIYAKSNPCGQYPDGVCIPKGGNFYALNQNHTDKFFDPGIKVEMDIKATAEFGVGVGLYDRGLMFGTRYIGVEPVNLLARAYARLQAGYCGVGFNIFYRMFLNFGPLKIFGIQVLADKNFEIMNERINPVSFNYRLPEALGLACDGEDADHWACTIMNAIMCGATSPEPVIPAAHGGTCVAHSDCDEDSGLRCINAQCLPVQPAGSLRVSLSWSALRDLNLQVSTPSGEVITRANRAELFAGTCSNPLDSANPACELTSSYGETLTLEGDAGQALPAGDYVISIFSAQSASTPSSQAPINFELEIEHEGVVQRSVKGQFIQDGGVAMVPVTFEYTVE